MASPVLKFLSTKSGEIQLRVAEPKDAAEICRLVDALAVYERLENESRPDPEALAADLESDRNPHLEAILAVDQEHRVVGFALFFANYSTFLTRWGIYLEDLFVEPSCRGSGIGYALLQSVAALAAERKAGRLDWSVLDWNAPAIQFYEQIGAVMKGDWRTMRLEGDALANLAEASLPEPPHA